MKGIIVGNISNSYKIESSGKIYTATARGKFKNQEGYYYVSIYYLI